MGRYFWSEVISLGGYDVLVKPFGAPDVGEFGVGELERTEIEALGRDRSQS